MRLLWQRPWRKRLRKIKEQFDLQTLKQVRAEWRGVLFGSFCIRGRMKSVDILIFEKYNKKYDKVKVQFVFFCTECGGKTVENLDLWRVMNET